MNAHEFLVSLTTVLGVAAVTTVVFQYLRQPVVLGYILAGLLVGPHVPFPLVADRATVQTLSELGVILLMFSLGLEFSLGTLVRLGPTAMLTALLQSSLMLWLGFVVGQWFGWSTTESVFTGAIIAISSTTIIAKAFEEQQVKGSLRQLVVGILVVEDLIAILLMATLTAVASGVGLSAAEMAATVGKLTLFLVLLVLVGLLIVPPTVRAVRRLGRPETTLVASVGFCFAVSLLAHQLGYSVALGAFIAGSLIAESGEAEEIEHLVAPVRDIFAAVFFVSVGLLIEPALVVEYHLPIVVLTLVVILGKVVGVSLGALLTGNGVRTSVRAGMSLAQIGEFSFIIAALGLSLQVTDAFLYPVAVAVSAITTLTTPWLIRASEPTADWVERKLPKRLQTFVVLYASWLEDLRQAPPAMTRGARIRRLVRLLAMDVVLLIGVAIAIGFGRARMATWVGADVGSESWAQAMVFGLAALLSLPMGLGILRVSRSLARVLAQMAMPGGVRGRPDLAAAPRQMFVHGLQLAILLPIGLLLLGVTQPTLGGVYVPILFGALVAYLAYGFWRGATELEGHVRAGSQAVVEAVLAQAHRGMAGKDMVSPEPALQQVHELLPGLGEPTAVRLAHDSPVIGRTLADLNLRCATGATVLVIVRADQTSLVPTARDVLQAGDILAVAGSHEAIDAARALLRTGTPETTDAPNCD